MTLLAFVLTAGGCGGVGAEEVGAGDPITSVATTTEQRAVLAARDRLVTAFADGDAQTYCAGITRATARAEARFIGMSCAKLIGAFADRAPRDSGGRREAKVVAVTVAGDRAVVVTRSPTTDRRDRTLFVRRSGRWFGEWRAEPTVRLDTAVGSN